MTFYDHKGRSHMARPGQVLPVGTILLEGSKWRTLTAPETVQKIMIEGNPYDNQRDSFVLKSFVK
jgi:hypothetical protein